MSAHAHRAQVENALTCVERVLHYTDSIPQEAQLYGPAPPPPDWPTSGAIEVRNLSARYRPETPIVLKNVSLSIAGGERVGVVGRTGSGKSTLFLTLFRLIEPEYTPGEPGPISIDGVDISKLGLRELRRKIAIIPQSPALFSGSVRLNIDPFDEKSDEEVWAALRQCQMSDVVLGMPSDDGNPLNAKVAEYGENLSQGQRQLLCLGRAILSQAKVLVLDEATSAVDVQTDALIQATIRSAFTGCTILTIAHRINTIIDSDKILVLGDGKVLEYASPSELLSDPSSAFSAIAAETRDTDPQDGQANEA